MSSLTSIDFSPKDMTPLTAPRIDRKDQPERRHGSRERKPQEASHLESFQPEK